MYPLPPQTVAGSKGNALLSSWNWYRERARAFQQARRQRHVNKNRRRRQLYRWKLKLLWFSLWQRRTGRWEVTRPAGNVCRMCAQLTQILTLCLYLWKVHFFSWGKIFFLVDANTDSVIFGANEIKVEKILLCVSVGVMIWNSKWQWTVLNAYI